MKIKFVIVLAICSGLFFQSCSTFLHQPTNFEKARVGETTANTELLDSLPEPQKPIVVGVYKFRDQTGQYKPTENGSTFSTAVTQGATSILIKALEDTQWFVPIERENLGNLLNERNIIRSTRKEYRKSSNPNEPQLPPLLYAGVVLEGGIVSYDSNILTGGFGVRYFGLGGSTRYRQDRITIYLRAVSTTSGEILKSVYVSKTILSQAIDANFFRYVKFKRLLEAETGITKNEPVQLAVKDAIEKGVYSLIVEGIADDLWSTKQGDTADKEMLDQYFKDKDETEEIKLYHKHLNSRRNLNRISFTAGGGFIDGDYGDPKLGAFAGMELARNINDPLAIVFGGSYGRLKNEGAYSSRIVTFDLNFQYSILPYEQLSPFVYGGAGGIIQLDNDNSAFKFQYGLGLEYLATKKVGLKVFGEQNIASNDKIDGLTSGKRNDYYWRFGFGVNFYFNNAKPDKK